ETPVLLLHGEDDARCPIEQSEQYFVALSRLGKEVELVRFPDSAHGFTRTGHPRMREEYLIRLLGWMDRHVGARRSDAPAEEPMPADGRAR
ncbi:MAG: prolyl oligopeptidase family serine peptidase, partial [Chloroflexi bacterium]|nr:prolyl oligopeptidase family serine peptidase [Chloroflexota bacterium]